MREGLLPIQVGPEAGDRGDRVTPEPATRNMRPLKSGVAEIYPPGHALREFFNAQPDELPNATLEALLPTILRLGRLRLE